MNDTNDCVSIGVTFCFTCLKADAKPLTEIHTVDLVDTDKQTFLDKLKFFTGTELEAVTDTMTMCLSCIKQLRASYKFKRTVLMSQETLKKFFIAQQTENHTLQFNVFTISTGDITEEDENSVKEEDNEAEEASNRLMAITEEDRVKAELNNDSDTCGDYYNIEENNVLCTQCKKFFSPKEITVHDCRTGGDDNDVKLESDDELTSERIEVKSMRKARKKGCRRKYQATTQQKSRDHLQVDCQFCSMTFDKNWKLQKHIARLHNDLKKYECTYCNKAFKQSYHLKEHITSHTGEKHFTCTVCDKKFQRLSSVSRHARSHQKAPGEKTKRTPYLCTICGKSFPFSNGAQRHMRIHLGIRRHECNVCNRKFSQSTHLHVHMRTHTGEKPYICDTCGETFALNAALQKHMSIHQRS